MTDREGASPSGEAPDRRGMPDVRHRCEAPPIQRRGLGAADANAAADARHPPNASADANRPTQRDRPVVADAPAEPRFARTRPCASSTCRSTRASSSGSRPASCSSCTAPAATWSRRRRSRPSGACYSWVAAVPAPSARWPRSSSGGCCRSRSRRSSSACSAFVARQRAARSSFVGIGTGLAGLVFSAVWIGYYAIVFGALPN